MVVTIPSFTYIHQTPSVFMLPLELVGTGVLEDQVPRVEARDGPLLHRGEGLVFMENLSGVQDDGDRLS